MTSNQDLPLYSTHPPLYASHPPDIKANSSDYPYTNMNRFGGPASERVRYHHIRLRVPNFRDISAIASTFCMNIIQSDRFLSLLVSSLPITQLYFTHWEAHHLNKLDLDMSLLKITISIIPMSARALNLCQSCWIWALLFVTCLETECPIMLSFALWAMGCMY